MRYRLFTKKQATQAWVCRGYYGSEPSALLAAQRLQGKYAFLKVVDENDRIVWSG